MTMCSVLAGRFHFFTANDTFCFYCMTVVPLDAGVHAKHTTELIQLLMECSTLTGREDNEE
jgi:hypothetical protein